VIIRGSLNIRNFISSVTNVKTTTKTTDTSIIQTRHRIPEIELQEGQTLVFQVPMPDILETVEPNTAKQKIMYANADYSKLLVLLYEDTSMFGDSRISNRYPVIVHNRYAMDPSPIPKYDTPKLNNNKELQHEIGFAMVVVFHDLGVIKHLTDIIVVMKNGQIVESGLTDQILEDPQHPYTQLLVSSIL
jgi:alpha-D-ribose 1-methylphosphonate 5-phosphate C-P lyase